MKSVHPRRALVAVAAGVTLALAGCSAAGPGTGATSGAFAPSGDVRMIVPFSAGGGSDISGRAIAAGLEKVTGVNISAENREGGSGAVGYSYLLSQQGKDNVLLASETALLALPLTQDVQFDSTSFTPIMKLGSDYTLIVTRPDSPWQSCSELVAAAAKDRVVAAVSGTTSLDQIVFTLIEQDQNMTFDRVPFESGGEVLAGLLGGQVDVASLNPSEILGQLQANTVKPLCAVSDQRYTYDALANIETAKEQGIDVAYAQYRGFIAPGGISEQARQYWIDAAKKFAETPAYTTYIEDNLLQADAVYGDDFTAYLQQASSDLAKVIG